MKNQMINQCPPLVEEPEPSGMEGDANLQNRMACETNWTHLAGPIHIGDTSKTAINAQALRSTYLVKNWVLGHFARTLTH